VDVLDKGLLDIATKLALLADGVAVLCIIGCGFYYMMARGNPRGQGQAWSWLVDVGKGAALVLGATAVAKLLTDNLKFG
jgi:hypothetical protein